MATEHKLRPTLSPSQRCLAGCLAAVLALLMAVSALLQPSPLGLGTHQQLGLPPCTFLAMFDRPCPSCGMTTSWAHLVRGQLIAALRANAGGTLLGLLAIGAAPWLAIAAVRGRWLGPAPGAKAWVWIVSAVVFVTLIQWGFRLAMQRPW